VCSRMAKKWSLNRDVVRRRPTAVVHASSGNGELTTKRKNWYRIRVFSDGRHRGDAPRGEDVYRRYTQGLLVLCESGVAFRDECGHEGELGHLWLQCIEGLTRPATELRSSRHGQSVHRQPISQPFSSQPNTGSCALMTVAALSCSHLRPCT
jgi:hypothetical protein